MRDIARTVVRETLRQRLVPGYDPLTHHVLLLRPDHLGDLLFLRPALRRFRSAMPDWRITLVVGPWARNIVQGDSSVDDVIEIPFPGFDRSRSHLPWQPYELLWREADRIRSLRPAAAVVLREDHWWGALLAQQAGVPTIVGANRSDLRSLVTEVVEDVSGHSVQRNATLLDFAATRLTGQTPRQPVNPHADPLIWQVDVAMHDRAAAMLQSAGINRPFVVLHPGSGAPVKLWPAKRWAYIARRIVERGFDVVLTGTSSETDMIESIRQGAGVHLQTLAGKTSVAELAAIFQQALLVAGVDSGPLHLAVAVGTPTLHIYGPSDVSIYGPWGDPRKHRVLRADMNCPACGDLSLSRPEGAGCMLAASELEVSDAVMAMLPR